MGRLTEDFLYRLHRGAASRFTSRPLARGIIFSRDNWRCVLCGSEKNLTVDHIKSVYQGGTNDYDNLQTLCNRCNAGKAP